MPIKDYPRFETHSHSEYSNIRLLDCINRPKDLLSMAAQLGYSGLTITDHEALCGHVDFIQAEKSLKEKGTIPEDFKLGLGNEIYLTDTRDKSQKYYHFILIAKNDVGHRALKELSSRAWYYSYYDRGMERVPTLKTELTEIINKYPNSLIGTTACLGGELPKLVFDLIKAEKSNNEEEIYECKKAIFDFLTFCRNLFGDDFYIEVAPGQSKDQLKYNERVKGIAAGMGIKMIFATDAHYLTAKDRFIHKSYLNSKDGDREIDDFYLYAHLMDNEEAFENLSPVFSEEEFAAMCAHTIEIMDKIEGYNLAHQPIIPTRKVENYMPRALVTETYPVLHRLCTAGNDQERYWVNECIENLDKLQPWKIKTEEGQQLSREDYLARLEIEADVISTIGEKLGNCLFAYFNTFQHYIDLFWECGSLSGPGRGSSVCFLSNYLLGITQLDPLRWNLMYWRFLNKERVELPDIDTDLSPSKRKLIFKKIREEIGEKNLLQVATFGTEGTRSAIQTACRGYRSEEYPDGIDVDIALYLSGLIPQERGFLWPLSDVINGNPKKDRKPITAFINEVDKYPGLLDIMLSIEGLVNKRGQHASGVILYNETPFETNAIMRSPNGDLITQFALHESEYLGK